MEKITIEKDPQGGYNIKQGDKLTDALCFEEAICVIIALMMQGNDIMPQRFLNWMKTKEEHNKWRKSVDLPLIQ